MISCCSCFGTKNTSKDEGIIGDKEDPIILQPKVSVKVSIILYPISFYTMLWLIHFQKCDSCKSVAFSKVLDYDPNNPLMEDLKMTLWKVQNLKVPE